jgi:hypothetical protein
VVPASVAHDVGRADPQPGDYEGDVGCHIVAGDPVGAPMCPGAYNVPAVPLEAGFSRLWISRELRRSPGSQLAQVQGTAGHLGQPAPPLQQPGPARA